eukprot:586600-Karenia_brevis.AAC.1
MQISDTLPTTTHTRGACRTHHVAHVCAGMGLPASHVTFWSPYGPYQPPCEAVLPGPAGRPGHPWAN